MAIPTPISADLAPLRTGPQNRRATQCDVRPWLVLHLCRKTREIAPVLELQFAAGMRPMPFTLAGPAEPGTWLAESPAADTASLLNAWREVRNWRHWIAQNDGQFEIVHAHCFSAGMAAARAGAPLVYDIRSFVEQQAASQDRGHSWLARSFRTAEQFVLQRAAVVIVHSSAVYRGALERGAASADVYVLPDLACAPDAELEPAWLRSLAERYDAVYGYALSRQKSRRGPLLPRGWQPLAACI
jgi:hypothetical protein